MGAVLIGGTLLCWVNPELFWRSFALVTDNAAMPLVRLLEAEAAHDWAIRAAKWGLVPRDVEPDAAELAMEVWGLKFPNPLGLAAGFDKHGEAVDSLLHTGFGFVEIGTITPLPQPGNPSPRMFRLTEDHAIINRYGFNSHGLEAVRKRLEARQHHHAPRGGLMGVNVGKNKLQEDAAADYSKGVRELGPYADYLVINVSSPNTPGLRSLQQRSAMAQLIQTSMAARDEVVRDSDGRRAAAGKSHAPLPLLIKIAPDLTDQEKQDIAEVVMETKIDGLVVSNTTVSRPASLLSLHKGETGGLSGAPLRAMSTQVIRDMYALTKGTVPILGVGGVATGEDVLEKIKAGASLVEMYSMLVYDGPGAPPRIKKGLLQALRRENFTSARSAVGADHKRQPWYRPAPAPASPQLPFHR
eukprot:GGOE01036582.1.p1 GENE.GGOE01036582.1~~GGOE01036582.1.p1  ORF type:complete len:453 (+),score=98.45 GGOE01036582.1:121-1359(+)